MVFKHKVVRRGNINGLLKRIIICFVSGNNFKTNLRNNNNNNRNDDENTRRRSLEDNFDSQHSIGGFLSIYFIKY